MKSLSKILFTIFIFLFLFSCTKEEEDAVVIAAHGITFNSATLYWHDVLPGVEHISVKIYLYNYLVAELEDAWSYELHDLDENTSYSGSIEVINLANSDSHSLLFSFTTLKNSPPEPFHASIGLINGESITLSWTKPFDPDGDIIEYDLILNDSIIANNLTETSYSIHGLDPLKKYSLSIIAMDNYGHNSIETVNFKSQATGSKLEYLNGEFNRYRREYGVYEPSDIGSEKLPLVIYLHGAGGIVWPKMIDNYFVTLAEKEKFILLMPQGRLFESGLTGWYYEDGIDQKFINQLIDTMILRYNVDPERVYLAGMSNGAFMTYLIAKVLEYRIAAIAPIAGTLGYYQYNTYSLIKPMPLCHIHGTADSIVQVQGNQTHVSFEKILDFWIPHNNVNPTPSITELPDKSTYDNSTVTKFEYYSIGTNDIDIIYYRINNGGHSVPGIQGVANQDINAYDEIWKFFKNRRLSDK